MNSHIVIGLLTGLIPIIVKMMERLVDAYIISKDHEREIELRKLDVELYAKEAEAASKWAKVPGAGNQVKKIGPVQAPFLNIEVPKWVNTIRGVIRPIVTIMLLLICTWMLCYSIINNTSQEQTLVETFSFLLVGSVLWWFSGRIVRK